MAMSFSLPFPPRLPMSLWSPSDPSSSSSSSLAAARGITSSSAHLLAVASASGVRDFLHHHSAGHLRLERLIASLLGAHKSPHFYGEGDILFGVPWKDSTVNSLLGTLSKAQTSFMYLFSGQGLGNRENQRRLRLENGNPKGSSGDVRWTNVLLALNIAAYLAQLATRGKLLLWGAKVNSLIDQGQIWRLATSSFLHANLIHLMVNCYSLNNVGPTMEKLLGKKRFLAVYLASAVAGSAMSYFFSKSPAVGASGAIFGLVGSSALFFLRHKNLIKSGEQEAKEIMRIVGLNIIFGLSTPGIDNWGHVGGLLGGIAVSWFLGPAWQPEIGDNGKPVLRDQAPVFKLIGTKKTG